MGLVELAAVRRPHPGGLEFHFKIGCGVQPWARVPRLLRRMNDLSLSEEYRDELAVAVANYCHPRRAMVAVTILEPGEFSDAQLLEAAEKVAAQLAPAPGGGNVVALPGWRLPSVNLNWARAIKEEIAARMGRINRDATRARLAAVFERIEVGEDHGATSARQQLIRELDEMAERLRDPAP